MDDSSQPVAPGVYRHFSGHLYRVISVGHTVVGHGSDELPGEPVVVYHALFTSERFGADHYWVRSVGNFLETVEHGGELVPRFTAVSPDGEAPSVDAQLSARKSLKCSDGHDA